MVALRVLQRIPVFQGLEDDSLRDLLGAVEEIPYESFSTIFLEDDSARYIYYLEAGRVSISIRDGTGYRRPVHLVRPGECFGWSALVPPHIFTASAQTQEASTVVRIDGDLLKRKMRVHSDLAWSVFENLAMTLSERLAGARVQLICATQPRGAASPTEGFL